jgi:hypothetical protein
MFSYHDAWRMIFDVTMGEYMLDLNINTVNGFNMFKFGVDYS